jgi:ketosteroid isomerase-like protein
VDTTDVDRWLERYVAAWKSYDRAEIGALFSEDAAYRYHPYDEPVLGLDAIVESWLEEDRLDEPGSFEGRYQAFAVEGDRAVAVGSSTYFDASGNVDRVYDNVYLLRFDGEGRCSEFTEWFMKRP